MCYSSKGPKNILGGSKEKVASECVKKRNADLTNELTVASIDTINNKY